MKASCLAVLAALAPTALAAEERTHVFEWLGAGGYVVRGALAFDAAAAVEGRITEAEVDCFVIEGFRFGASIGRWALTMRRPETTWILTFEVAAGAFAVWGPDAAMPQAWNMDGYGTDCGPGGFGFNIGNAAQDLCLDGELLVASQIAPERPFPAARDDGYRFPADACDGPLLMGRAAPVTPEAVAVASR